MICIVKEVKLLDKSSPMAMLEKHSQLGIRFVLISKNEAIVTVIMSKIEHTMTPPLKSIKYTCDCWKH